MRSADHRVEPDLRVGLAVEHPDLVALRRGPHVRRPVGQRAGIRPSNRWRRLDQVVVDRDHRERGSRPTSDRPDPGQPVGVAGRLTRPAPGSGRSARPSAAAHRASGSTRRSVRAHRPASAPVGSRPAVTGGPARRRRARRPRAPRRRRPAGRCRRPAPGPTPRRARRRRWPRSASGVDARPRSSMVAHRERRRLVGGPARSRRASIADVEVVQRGPPAGIVERHPLAPQVGLPDRHPTGVARAPARSSHRSTPSRPADPVHEQARRRWTGPPISTLPGAVWGTVQSPSTSTPLGDDGPHDQRRRRGSRARRRRVGAGHQLLAERVDRARRRASAPPAGVDPADRRRRPTRSRGSRPTSSSPAAGGDRRVPPGEVEQRQRGHGHDRVDARRRRRARGWPPPGPASSRPRRGGLAPATRGTAPARPDSRRVGLGRRRPAPRSSP